MPDKDPAPVPARIISHAFVDGVYQPVLVFEDLEPKAGEALRVLLENGVTYATTIHGVADTLEGLRFVTSGLEPLPAP